MWKSSAGLRRSLVLPLSVLWLWVCILQGPRVYGGTNASVTIPTVATTKRSAFNSSGKAIRTEWFIGAKGGASNPTVLILPGSGGIEDSGGFFRDMAAALSASGRTVVIVHYMDRSGLTSASNAQMSAHFSQWLQTVHDAAKFVQQQPGVDPKRVSLLGHSLGAQLALHAAATDPSLQSVVDMSGCFVLPTKNITHMPPVLILHGGADRVVPMTREQQLVAVLKRCGSSYDEHIFKGADHAFQNQTEAGIFSVIERFLNGLEHSQTGKQL
jgi:carboxymethylenebutenolidase